MTFKKITLSFILFFAFLNNLFAYEKEHIFSDAIKINSIENNLYKFEIKANWSNLPIAARKTFEFFKISHSTSNPDIIYPDNYVWYSTSAEDTIVKDNFSNYSPNEKGINYYRVCIVADKYYCSKTPLIINTTRKEEITLEELSKIKTFLRDYKETISFIVKSSYLTEKIGIKTDDLSMLSKQFLTTKDFLKTKNLIELVTKDIRNTKEIENFINEYKNKNYTSKEEINEVGGQLDNWLDINSRNIEELGKYELIQQNEDKLNDLKDILKNTLKELENKNTYTRSLTIESKKENTSGGMNFSGYDSTPLGSLEIKATDDSVKYLTYIFITIILSFFAYFIIKKTNFNNLLKNKDLNIQNKENILQILKSENEYIVEYNGIYNKGIKVLEQNKKNITQAIYSYVNSINKLQVRGVDLYEELNNLDIKIPDLKESGSTIYRLYLPENIRNSLKNDLNNNPLVIKTDEQEIPWEIMYDSDNFLSLKTPISRKIMTRESIRKNESVKNKTPKILFITNPTLDLDGSIKETKEIINKLGKKADITLITGKEVTSTKIFSLFGQNNFDIIHYSGHAYFDKLNPDNSGLILNDSTITASEIKRVLNGNPLIFLNGCSSGRSDEKDFDKTGEDTTGIASSFLIGGASGVISTLWPVTDKASSSFAIEFYDNFLKYENIGNSILKAKKETYIKFPHDITWASFIYYGDPNLTINKK